MKILGGLRKIFKTLLHSWNISENMINNIFFTEKGAYPYR